MFGQKKNKLIGATLIEVMTVLFVFSIIAVTFYAIWSMGLRFIIESKNKMGATALLNEKMEIVRNLPYASIGVSGGVPSGNIPETETKSVNTCLYTITTHINYVDDPYDGVYPTDTIPVDYKSVRVEISWLGPNGTTRSTAVGVARFVPPGLEVADPNAGVLAVNIMDSSGTGVPQALVQIINNAVSPVINMTRSTDNFGNIILPGFPQSIGNYQLIVSKNGYETISTLSVADSATIANNYTDNHASVVTGSLSTKTIIQDKLANLKIRSEDAVGADIPNVTFHIKGGRRLGTNVGVDVYNLDQNDVTGSDGEKTYSNKSPGAHFLSGIVAPSGYTLISIDQMTNYDKTNNIYSFSLLPEANETIRLRFASNGENALLVKVLDNSTHLPIKDATVEAKNSVGYDNTQTTKQDGVVFFPVTADPFVVGDYDLTVSAAGYQTETKTITVNQLTSEDINLSLN